MDRYADAVLVGGISELLPELVGAALDRGGNT
jgi:hypothetical protein